MQVNKTAAAVFIMGCLIFPVQAQCVVMTQITPSNVVLPAAAGEIFSFDFVVSGDTDAYALAFQSTIRVSGPGLEFNGPSSKTVSAATDYWIENSIHVTAFVQDSNYVFGDYTSDAELLVDNDIMARYAFKWGGTEGNYTFTLDLNTSKSFVQKDDFGIEALYFTPGSYPGNSNSFTVSVPEPSTLVIFVLGSAVLLKKRST